jgi:hypothetical protein
MQSINNAIIDLKSELHQNWSDRLPKLVLIIVLVVFFSYSVFLAINLKSGLIPDENAHFVFSKHYSTTWGIPPDVTETYQLGWYIQQNPFLYYYVNGRIINIAEFAAPNITERQLLVTLRVVSAIFALGTAVVCYLLSKKIIKHRWWQLLPVFLLTNTLMFVYLSGGVNYDNLANLLSMAAIYFLVRVLDHDPFVRNSLGWMICVFSGTLVKYPILPLALAMSIVWMIFVFMNRKRLFPIDFIIRGNLFFFILLFAVIAGNLAIYGLNLIAYRTLTPPCNEILAEAQCTLSPYYKRYNKIALEQKLTINQAIESGYPDPITYIFDSWLPNMFYRIFGILGHESYFPAKIIILYRLLFYWIIFLAIRYWRKPNFTHVSLMGIFIFYILVLLITNYDSELVYGFRQIAIQGRYIFPVIGIVYVLLSKVLSLVPSNKIKYATLVVSVVLFLYGGPIKLIRYYDTEFLTWFLR